MLIATVGIRFESTLVISSCRRALLYALPLVALGSHPIIRMQHQSLQRPQAEFVLSDTMKHLPPRTHVGKLRSHTLLNRHLWWRQYCTRGGKLIERQHITVHVTRGCPSCSLWFILPRWGWQRPCEECFNLTTLQRGLSQLCANKAAAVKPRLAHTPKAQRSHSLQILQRLSCRRWDSWTQLMSRKWWEVRGDQSHVRQITTERRGGLQVCVGWGAVSLLGDGTTRTLKR